MASTTNNDSVLIPELFVPELTVPEQPAFEQSASDLTTNNQSTITVTPRFPIIKISLKRIACIRVNT